MQNRGWFFSIAIRDFDLVGVLNFDIYKNYLLLGLGVRTITTLGFGWELRGKENEKIWRI